MVPRIAADYMVKAKKKDEAVTVPTASANPRVSAAQAAGKTEKKVDVPQSGGQTAAVSVAKTKDPNDIRGPRERVNPTTRSTVAPSERAVRTPTNPNAGRSGRSAPRPTATPDTPAPNPQPTETPAPTPPTETTEKPTTQQVQPSARIAADKMPAAIPVKLRGSPDTRARMDQLHLATHAIQNDDGSYTPHTGPMPSSEAGVNAVPLHVARGVHDQQLQWHTRTFDDKGNVKYLPASALAHSPQKGQEVLLQSGKVMKVHGVDLSHAGQNGDEMEKFTDVEGNEHLQPKGRISIEHPEHGKQDISSLQWHQMMHGEFGDAYVGGLDKAMRAYGRAIFNHVPAAVLHDPQLRLPKNSTAQDVVDAIAAHTGELLQTNGLGKKLKSSLKRAGIADADFARSSANYLLSRQGWSAEGRAVILGAMMVHSDHPDQHELYRIGQIARNFKKIVMTAEKLSGRGMVTDRTIARVLAMKDGKGKPLFDSPEAHQAKQSILAERRKQEKAKKDAEKQKKEAENTEPEEEGLAEPPVEQTPEMLAAEQRAAADKHNERMGEGFRRLTEAGQKHDESFREADHRGAGGKLFMGTNHGVSAEEQNRRDNESILAGQQRADEIAGDVTVPDAKAPAQVVDGPDLSHPSKKEFFRTGLMEAYRKRAQEAEQKGEAAKAQADQMTFHILDQMHRGNSVTHAINTVLDGKSAASKRSWADFIQKTLRRSGFLNDGHVLQATKDFSGKVAQVTQLMAPQTTQAPQRQAAPLVQPQAPTQVVPPAAPQVQPQQDLVQQQVPPQVQQPPVQQQDKGGWDASGRFVPDQGTAAATLSTPDQPDAQVDGAGDAPAAPPQSGGMTRHPGHPEYTKHNDFGPASKHLAPMSESKQIGPDLYVAKQLNTGSHASVAADSRPLLYVHDGKGRGSWMYQSFMGTGGKQQGDWHPVGGVLGSTAGTHKWIIKGNPATDPAYGRPGLKEFQDKVNAVLPHTDEQTHPFLKGLTEGKLENPSLADDGMASHIAYAVPKNYTDIDNKDKREALDRWKRGELSPVWGQRGQRPPERTAAATLSTPDQPDDVGDVPDVPADGEGASQDSQEPVGEGTPVVEEGAGAQVDEPVGTPPQVETPLATETPAPMPPVAESKPKTQEPPRRGPPETSIAIGSDGIRTQGGRTGEAADSEPPPRAAATNEDVLASHRSDVAFYESRVKSERDAKKKEEYRQKLAAAVEQEKDAITRHGKGHALAAAVKEQQGDNVVPHTAHADVLKARAAKMASALPQVGKHSEGQQLPEGQEALKYFPRGMPADRKAFLDVAREGLNRIAAHPEKKTAAVVDGLLHTYQETIKRTHGGRGKPVVFEGMKQGLRDALDDFRSPRVGERAAEPTPAKPVTEKKPPTVAADKPAKPKTPPAAAGKKAAETTTPKRATVAADKKAEDAPAPPAPPAGETKAKEPAVGNNARARMTAAASTAVEQGASVEDAVREAAKKERLSLSDRQVGVLAADVQKHTRPFGAEKKTEASVGVGTAKQGKAKDESAAAEEKVQKGVKGAVKKLKEAIAKSSAKLWEDKRTPEDWEKWLKDTAFRAGDYLPGGADKWSSAERTAVAKQAAQELHAHMQSRGASKGEAGATATPKHKGFKGFSDDQAKTHREDAAKATTTKEALGVLSRVAHRLGAIFDVGEDGVLVELPDDENKRFVSSDTEGPRMVFRKLGKDPNERKKAVREMVDVLLHGVKDDDVAKKALPISRALVSRWNFTIKADK